MLVWANFEDIYLRGMRDRSMRSGTELAREIQLTDWSTVNKPVYPVLRSTNTVLYLYSCWALFVFFELQLDNNYLLRFEMRIQDGGRPLIETCCPANNCISPNH